MSGAGWGSCWGMMLLCLFASGAGAESPLHERRPVRLLSTVEARYRIVQEDREVGVERVSRRTYDDNRVVFDATMATDIGGIKFSQTSTLVLEEESYFPRSFRTDKTIEQPTDTLRIAFTADMYSNVAVVGSEIRGRTDSRRLVVPVGIPIIEAGTLYPWYEVLFWLDLETRDRQRIQWLEPQSVRVEDGEIYLTGTETVEVMGKRTEVSVFKAERERLGPAKLYVDARKRIVRCEQNMNVFELVEWTEQGSENGDKR